MGTLPTITVNNLDRRRALCSTFRLELIPLGRIPVGGPSPFYGAGVPDGFFSQLPIAKPFNAPT